MQQMHSCGRTACLGKPCGTLNEWAEACAQNVLLAPLPRRTSSGPCLYLLSSRESRAAKEKGRRKKVLAKSTTADPTVQFRSSARIWRTCSRTDVPEGRTAQNQEQHRRVRARRGEQEARDRDARIRLQQQTEGKTGGHA